MKAKQIIEVVCDEDGSTFVCFGTMNKKKALKSIRDFMSGDCGVDKQDLPKLDDINLNPCWNGFNEGDQEWWYYLDNPPEKNKYVGSCWRFDFN